VAGAVVEFAPGYYEQPARTDWYKPAHYARNIGEQNKPIVFVARHYAVYYEDDSSKRSELAHDGGADVVLDPQPAEGDGGPVFGVDGYADQHDIAWVGFYVDENNSNPETDSGPIVFYGAKRCIADYWVVQGSDGYQPHTNHNAVRIEGSSDVRLRNWRARNIKNGSSADHNSSAIMGYDTSDIEIHHFETIDCLGGIFPKGGEDNSNWRVSNGLVNRCFAALVGLHVDYSETGNPVNMWNIAVVEGRNICRWLQGSTTSQGPRNWNIQNVAVYNSAKPGNEIYNSQTNAVQGMSIRNLAADGIEHIHNYYGSRGTPAQGDIAIDYNCYKPSGSPFSNYSEQEWKNDGFDAASLFDSDPQFEDASSDKLEALAGSPCINAGKDRLNLLGQGSDKDINIGLDGRLGQPGVVPMDSGTFRPAVLEPFDFGIIGDKVQAKGFGTETFYQDANGYNGTVYAQTIARANGSGETTFEFGAFRELPNVLGEGDEAWVRLRLRFYEKSWLEAEPYLKFLRWEGDDPSGGNEEGYMDFLITTGNEGRGYEEGGMMAAKENVLGGPDAGGYLLGPYHNLPANEWFTVEQHVKFHSDPAVGFVRYFKNGSLVDGTNMQTLYKSSEIVTYALLFTYWNRYGAERPYNDQRVDVEDYALADSNNPPPVRANGYPMIEEG
jgi:hypothetical protein